MNNLFVEILQVSLGNREKFSRIPSEKEWEELYELSQLQAVTGVLVDGLERLPLEQRPPKLQLLQWLGIAQMTEVTYKQHCALARELSERFSAVGFRPCVLKGIGLAQLYPHPERRQVGDIDLWVEGDRKQVIEWLKTVCPIEREIWHHVEAHFYEAVLAEVHFHPCWLYNPFYNRKLQKWFESQKYNQMGVDGQLGFAYPSVPFNAVYTLVHTYHHLIEEGVGFRHIVDYYYVVRALPSEERDCVVMLLRRFGMLRLARAMMWVLQTVCGMEDEYLICAPDEREGRFLLDEIERGGNFGHFRSDERKRNSVWRLIVFFPHYPCEVLWVVPWKLWHKAWRAIYLND